MKICHISNSLIKITTAGQVLSGSLCCIERVLNIHKPEGYSLSTTSLND